MSYSIGIPDKSRIFWADMNDIKLEITKFIDSPFTDKLSVLTLLGDYGLGKTHSLNYIRHSIQSDSSDKLIILDFPHPFENFIVFFETLLKNIPLTHIFTIVKQAIEKRKSQVTSILKEGYDEEILDSIMIFEKARDTVLKTIYPDMHSDFRTVLVKLLSTESKDILSLAENWLTGAPITSKQLNELGVSGKLTESIAPKIVADYLRIYLNNGGRILILIDEFEDLGVIGSKQSLVSFRHFLDENLPNVKMVITLTIEAFNGIRTGRDQFVRKGYPPLFSRLNVGKKIRFSNLNEIKIKQFLTEYIKHNNKDIKKVTIRKQTLSLIYNRTDGSPRTLSVLANYLTDLANFDGDITHVLAAKSMDELKIKPENETETGEPLITI